MKTARLIARFLRVKAGTVRRQCFAECAMSLGIGFAVLLFQYAYYFLAIWALACFQGAEAVAIALVTALLPVALQFVAYALAGDSYRDPASALMASPTPRLLYVGFLFVGPQTCAGALKSLRKAWRVTSTDFDNCGNVLYVMMTEPDAITIAQAAEAVSIRQSVNVILDQIRLFPGVIVRPSELRITPGLRIEIADFCRNEKDRIHASAAVDDVEDW